MVLELNNQTARGRSEAQDKVHKCLQCYDCLKSELPMSEEQLKAFAAAVQSDPTLQQKLKDAETQAIVAIAKDAGFTINAEELNQSQTNLSDDDLERMAGGWKPEDGFCTIGFALSCIF